MRSRYSENEREWLVGKPKQIGPCAQVWHGGDPIRITDRKMYGRKMGSFLFLSVHVPVIIPHLSFPFRLFRGNGGTRRGPARCGPKSSILFLPFSPSPFPPFPSSLLPGDSPRICPAKKCFGFIACFLIFLSSVYSRTIFLSSFPMIIRLVVISVY